VKFTAEQIAQALNGKVEGDKMAEVSTLAKIEEGGKGALCFLSNPKYTHYLYSTKASVVIVNNGFVAEKKYSTTLIRVRNAYAAFAAVLELYQKSRPSPQGISSMAVIAESAKLGKNVFIDAFVVIGENVVVGDNTQIFSNAAISNNVSLGTDCIINSGVKVYEDCIIGAHCTIHSGAIVGADGFGFAPQDSKDYKKIPQIGNVILEDRVEIGANTTIDRATMGSTIIRKGVKIDNLIQIAHNVEIGENTVIAAQTGISGSTKIGKNCMIGGQVGIVGHLVIADGVMIAAQSGVGKSITEENSIVEGSPAFGIRNYQRSYVHFRRLDSLVKRVNELERNSKSK